MLFLNLKTVAEQLMESAQNHGYCQNTGQAIKYSGCFKITDSLAFSGFYVDGSQSSKLLHRQLVSSLGMLDGLTLPDSELLSVGAFYQLLPHHLRPIVDESDIGKVLSDKMGIPADIINESEIEKLMSLRQTFDNEIF